ncbi:MAG TPA: hypothetical protein VKS60_02845 [Stellaceae bacterium]|nr:hypothetical protein [Stellaceae bacterium]
MTRGRPLFSFIAMFGLAASAGADDQVKSMKGRWHMDMQQSSDPASAVRSSSMVVTIDDGETFEATRIDVTPDGKEWVSSFRAAYDGKSYPVTEAGAKMSVTLARLTRDSFRIDFSQQGGWHNTGICRFSADGNTVSCTGTDIDERGNGVPYKRVFVRD